MAKGYDVSDIEILEGTEAVRKKLSMYLGSSGSDAMYHATKEIVDNAVDEILAGRNNIVGMYIDDQGVITVWDGGKGIPTGVHPKYKINTLTAVFTKLHAGGKLGGGKAYSVSGGTHGIGATATNATSELFEVNTYFNSKWWSQTFKKGKPTSSVKKIGKPNIELPSKVRKFAGKAKFSEGTIIRFKFDLSVFDKKSKLDLSKMPEWFELQSYLNEGSYFVLYTPKHQKVYYNKEGVKAFIKKEASDYELDGQPFVFSSKNISCGMQFCSSDENMFSSFACGIKTVDGGTHEQAFYKVLQEALAPYKGKREYRIDDLKVGLVGLLNVKIPSPKFTSQTKEKLASTEAADIVIANLSGEIKKYFASNKALAKRIVDRAAAIREAQQQWASNKKLAAALKTNKGGRSLLPAKLAGSTTKDPSKRELFIVEGDSAKGTPKQARDPNFQEILPIRGKIQNAYKVKKVSDVVESQTVIDILKAIGYNPANKNPVEHLRIGRLIFLADADEDGLHINVLLIALIHRLMPSLFEKGMVYLVDAPLFKSQIGSKNVYAATLRDLKKMISPNAPITRMKGWGEAEASLIREVAMDEKTRRLMRVKIIEKGNGKKFISLVGEDITMRKELMGI